MPKVNLNHMEASILLALLISVVLGVVTKKSDKERWNYGLYCFGCFMDLPCCAAPWLRYGQRPPYLSMSELLFCEYR